MAKVLDILYRYFTYPKLKILAMGLILAGVFFTITNLFEERGRMSSFPKHAFQAYRRTLEKQLQVEEVRVKLPEQWKSEYQGKANLHVFQDWCGQSTNDLRKNVHYPLYPHTRTTVSRLAVSPHWKTYGMRIFGYIHPSMAGEYIFAIGSDDNAEFWLSEDESTENLKLMAYVGKTGLEWTAPGEYEKFASQVSQPVQMKSMARYYFEVIHKQSEGPDHVEVAWRPNIEGTTFKVIGSKYISLYKDETDLLMGESAHIPQTVASHEMSMREALRNVKYTVDMVKKDPRDTIFNIPLVNDSYLQNLLPECTYNPSYIFQGTSVGRYNGLHYVQLSSVYPNDFTRQTHVEAEQMCIYQDEKDGFARFMDVNPKEEDWGAEETTFLTTATPAPVKENPPQPAEGEEPNVVYEEDALWERVFDVKHTDFQPERTDVVVKSCRRAGNVVMSRDTAMPVVHILMKALRKKHPSWSLERVLNVERRVDEKLGSRYFLELEIETAKGEHRLLSRYVYVPNSHEEKEEPGPMLCSPQGFSWNPKATVNILIAVRNQARWVVHFINQMEKIYRATKDENFNVVITDHHSDDLDVEKALQKADLPRYQYKRLEGTFEKTVAVQTAIDLVEDDHSIIFLCDLHLHYPLNFIDTIRKHTVEGKMTYAPIVMRLDCGSSHLEPTGFWELAGYGLLGIYKSDMIRIGGMNTKEFKDKWGGEDWDTLDRVVENKLEVERLHLRNFLHFYHTKRGMWNSRIRKPSS
ncbi:beta-1,4-N-acetylgalactosaminyltransferase 3-like isoform X1 [Denticeps clupeoides]|uniref:beta-1,4-N-acetylgalactosaminyltransferase 3-like isoform X1 n=2 Tax=Denticeps clupeoides TaxID=299321 RepID=UPI0010A580CD|nr:beta-1,4-N-acetylgalactosaminyltransferase 3-like isoform X1 [Denticeps clupeoides]